MPNPHLRTGLKQFLRILHSILPLIAGISFLFGGRLVHETTHLDRLLAELLGIGLAFLCLIGVAIAHHWIDDIEWREANEKAASTETNTKS
jgi:hypothetical protein